MFSVRWVLYESVSCIHLIYYRDIDVSTDFNDKMYAQIKSNFLPLLDMIYITCKMLQTLHAYRSLVNHIQ